MFPFLACCHSPFRLISTSFSPARLNHPCSPLFQKIFSPFILIFSCPECHNLSESWARVESWDIWSEKIWTILLLKVIIWSLCQGAAGWLTSSSTSTQPLDMTRGSMSFFKEKDFLKAEAQSYHFISLYRQHGLFFLFPACLFSFFFSLSCCG